MATLTVQRTNRTTGINYATASVAASSGGDKWINTGAETAVVTNGGGSPITLTQVFGVQAVVDGVAPANRTISVAAGETLEVGPFPPQNFNDANGYMNLQYSGVTSVSVLVRANGS